MEVSKFFSNGKMLQQAIDQLRLAPAKVQTSAYCFFLPEIQNSRATGFSFHEQIAAWLGGLNL
jgi:hypothetical protein